MPERILSIENKFKQLHTLMVLLREECPWDQKQTIESLRRCLLEESHEVLEAMETAHQTNQWQDLRSELGDLLLQISFHCCIAEEKKQFNFDDVIDTLVVKMIYRHPHVFADAKPQDLLEQWESLKDDEHQERTSLMDGIPPLPALAYAQKQQERAARVGFDWDRPDDVIEKMQEELDELAYEIRHQHPQSRIEDEFGDVLFTLTNLARQLNIDAELCLMQSNRKFDARFRRMENIASKESLDLKQLKLDALEALYQQAKQEIMESI
ncbi:MAG: nucleoside triphosphate pyrophosphohydrolase [Zetaproteobacteria bacterium]|nr:nucleoside triphosphate pyrophosphohydrolase [Zetaproteobacteria bacterium]